jgi:mannosyl-3-phosphoglycerate phosphatase
VTRLAVFTDLDGTLLETGTYDCSAAHSTLATLKARGAVVVAVTSRTRAEVERLFGELAMTPAGIVENGSVIHMTENGAAREIVLGCTLAEATLALARLQAALSVPLTSLGALPVTDVARITGLSEAEAALAIRREHSHVILPPPEIPFAVAARVAAELGVRLIEGDRFWHLVGAGVEKGRAVRMLRASLTDDFAQTIGLGNGPSDAGLLEAVDVPIVVPGPSGPHHALVARGWAVAPGPGPAGWAAAVTAVLSSMDA